jgi:hypothetical protein
MARIIVNIKETGATVNGLIVSYHGRRVPGGETEAGNSLLLPWSEVTSSETVEAAVIVDAREKLSGASDESVVVCGRVAVI